MNYKLENNFWGEHVEGVMKKAQETSKQVGNKSTRIRKKVMDSGKYFVNTSY